jgi:SAM-dependent methyltransferase
MADLPYVGGELDLFSQALNWKSYWSGRLGPYLRGDVLEVGAGIGANTLLLRSDRQHSWLCLEPDRRLAGRLEQAIETAGVRDRCAVRVGTLADLEPGDLFDAILYIDVMEHIEDDRSEAARAASHLRPDGILGVLAPAHPSLFSPFDASVGHFRRYTRETLKEIIPPSLDAVVLQYMDAVGLSASLLNRLLLRQSMPTMRQIRTWDRLMVPCSRLIDPLLGYRLGKSVLGIWRKRRSS